MKYDDIAQQHHMDFFLKGTGEIPKEGTNLYWVAKLQGTVESHGTLALRR
jgi:hypothetical protein